MMAQGNHDTEPQGDFFAALHLTRDDAEVIYSVMATCGFSVGHLASRADRAVESVYQAMRTIFKWRAPLKLLEKEAHLKRDASRILEEG